MYIMIMHEGQHNEANLSKAKAAVKEIVVGLEVSLYNRFSVPFIVVNLQSYNGSIIIMVVYIASVHSHTDIF